MGDRVSPIKYTIDIIDLKENTKSQYSYSSYKEALEYYVIYKNAFKNCIITLSAVLTEVQV